MSSGPLLAAFLALAAGFVACAPSGEPERALTVSGSAVGAEGQVLARQVESFRHENPGLRVAVQNAPDDATQRHQLYVQWLNARLGTPDVLQLDVIWTPEFAAAGWLLPLDGFTPSRDDLFPASLAADSWQGKLFAMPWFLDVGMLYWRTDLLAAPPATLDEMVAAASRAMAAPGGPRSGFVWQGARYEGLVTVFLEALTACGGQILGPRHRVAVDSPQGVRALAFLRSLVDGGLSPREVLTWHEEETRFAFQNGNAVFLRNWPYARPLLAQPGSQVRGRFAVAPLPAAALGGAQLAVNAYSRHPAEAWRLIAYLTAPERMLERAAAAGEFPARRSVYGDPRLSAALGMPAEQSLRLVLAAVPRPPTPIYSELSEILQVHLHRSIAGQAEPAQALHDAAREMDQAIERSGLRELEARHGT